MTRVPSVLELTRLTTRRMTLALAFLVSCAATAAAQMLYTVSGECMVAGPGVLRMFIVDEEGFKVPMSGLAAWTGQLDASGADALTVDYFFRVPRGTYGIRCYLDVNGNGTLDGGRFGPTEPWAMSWKARRSLGFPRFADISFVVDRDVSRPLLKLD